MPDQPWFTEVGASNIRPSPYNELQHRYRGFILSRTLGLKGVITCDDVRSGQAALAAFNEQFAGALIVYIDRCTLEVVDADFCPPNNQEKEDQDA